MTWANRIVASGEEAPDQLLANPRNWRIHPRQQREALRGVLRDVGIVQEVIVNRTTGMLVDGHLRVDLAMEEGQPTIPVKYVELSEEEEAEILATIDPLSAMATADAGKLGELLSEVHSSDTAVQEMLAELAEREGLGAGQDEVLDEGPEAEMDRAAELMAEWGTESGQLWQAGEHRVLCGDATSKVDVGRLLGSVRPLLMVTDPPYGVEYDPKWRVEAGVNKNKGKMGEVQNDGRADWREAWALFPGAVSYVWHAGRYGSVVQASLEATGFEIRAQLIWRKETFAISRGHYHWAHEPCFYAVRSGKSARWSGDRSQSTVWEIGRRDPTGSTNHGTQKPVECMARAIRNHGTPGDLIYDPFLGSGTTVIAAETLGRRCYGLEIDPRYVDVIVTRWQNFTGRQAERVEA